MNWFGTLGVGELAGSSYHVISKTELIFIQQGIHTKACPRWVSALECSASRTDYICSPTPSLRCFVIVTWKDSDNKDNSFLFLVPSFFFLSHFYNCNNDNNNKVIIENFRYLEKSPFKNKHCIFNSIYFGEYFPHKIIISQINISLGRVQVTYEGIWEALDCFKSCFQ